MGCFVKENMEFNNNEPPKDKTKMTAKKRRNQKDTKLFDIYFKMDGKILRTGVKILLNPHP